MNMDVWCPCLGCCKDIKVGLACEVRVNAPGWCVVQQQVAGITYNSSSMCREENSRKIPCKSTPFSRKLSHQLTRQTAARHLARCCLPLVRAAPGPHKQLNTSLVTPPHHHHHHHTRTSTPNLHNQFLVYAHLYCTYVYPKP